MAKIVLAVGSLYRDIDIMKVNPEAVSAESLQQQIEDWKHRDD